MYEFKTNKILKKDFLKLNEDDVMFITNPGRMGDEDGSTFIIKQDNKYKIYRLSGWMYPNKETEISLDDALNQFPKWKEVWNNNGNEEKYKYIYMGFGNGLSVDNSIYDEFKPYLDKRVEEYLKEEKDKKGLQYAAIFNTWKEAFIDMINNRKESANNE